MGLDAFEGIISRHHDLKECKDARCKMQLLGNSTLSADVNCNPSPHPMPLISPMPMPDDRTMV